MHQKPYPLVVLEGKYRALHGLHLPRFQDSF